MKKKSLIAVGATQIPTEGLLKDSKIINKKTSSMSEKVQKKIGIATNIEGTTTLLSKPEANEKYIAIVAENNEIIMISNGKSPILKRLKEKEGVKVVPMEEYRETFKHMSEEEIADIEEKIETFLLLDEVENVSHEVLSEAYVKKQAQRKADTEREIARAERLERTGYDIDRHGTVRKVKNSPVHLGRNDMCICGSGKKWKKCCMPK